MLKVKHNHIVRHNNLHLFSESFNYFLKFERNLSEDFKGKNNDLSKYPGITRAEFYVKVTLLLVFLEGITSNPIQGPKHNRGPTLVHCRSINFAKLVMRLHLVVFTSV